MVYLIAYTLNNPIPNDHLIHAIKTCGDWAHCLGDAWLVQSDDSSKYLFDILHPYLGEHDYMFITEVNNNHFGCLDHGIWRWLAKKGY